VFERPRLETEVSIPLLPRVGFIFQTSISVNGSYSRRAPMCRAFRAGSHQRGVNTGQREQTAPVLWLPSPGSTARCCRFYRVLGAWQRACSWMLAGCWMRFSKVHPGWKDKPRARDSALRWLVPVGKFGPVP